MKATVNFKIYDVTDWTTINYKAHNAQCFENVSLQKIISGQLIEQHEKLFSLKNYTQNVVEKLVPDPFIKNEN